MELKDYPRPKNDNGRGIHWSPGLYNDHLFETGEIEGWVNELLEMQIKWVKVIDDGGGSTIELCERLLENDIFPVVRLYMDSPGHIRMREEETIRDLISIGVRYFETKNEPDLDIEWHDDRKPPNWLDIVVDDFIYDADRVLPMGGHLAMPSMGVGTIVNPFAKVVDRGRSDIFHHGAWVAIHNYTLNHPLDYPFDAIKQTGQPLTELEYEEVYLWLVQWIFEYIGQFLSPQECASFEEQWDWDDPKEYEEIYAGIIDIFESLERLSFKPGQDERKRYTYQAFRGRFGWDNLPLSVINQERMKSKEPGATLDDDATCFLAYELTNRQVVEAFGHPVPIMSTEGGVVVADRQDGRYPRNDPRTHAELTLWINQFLQGEAPDFSEHLKGKAPDYYFTVFHWLIANTLIGVGTPGWETQCWYTNWWNKEFGLEGRLPTVDAVKAMPSKTREAVVNDAVIRGRLAEDSGAAAEDRIVRIHRDGQAVAWTPSRAGGHFHFVGLAPGTYHLTVDGVFGLMAKDFQVASHTTETLEMKLPAKQSAIEGTVIDKAGKKIRGLVVTAWVGDYIAASASTDADGRYRLAILAAGTYRLTAGDVAVEHIQLDGRETKTVKLLVSKGLEYKYQVVTKRLLPPQETREHYRLYGRVLDENGRPIDGVKVQMSWTGAEPGTVFPTTSSGSDMGKPRGYYEFVPSQGEFQLKVVQGDWESQVAEGLKTRDVLGREGKAVAYEVDFQLRRGGEGGVVEPAQSVIRGTITDETGAAWASLRLILHLDGREVDQTLTSAEGRYAFSNLAAGSYDLSAEGVGAVQADIALDGKRSKTIDLVVEKPSARKQLYHYLLFGPASSPETRRNFQLAHKYILRFAPVVGFNPQEAIRAQHVTIIGETVSQEAETRLREAGCRVERLGGDSGVVEQALHDLVQGDSRFKTL